MTESIKPSILVVDDNPAIQTAFSAYLRKKGYRVEQAGTLREMNRRLRTTTPDAIVLDLYLPDGKSLNRIAELRSAYPNTGIIMVTADGSIEDAVEAMQWGADNFLSKPVKLNDLGVFLDKGLELNVLRQGEAHRKVGSKSEDPFFGEHPMWRKVYDHASLAARHDNTVLLLGETGTGKSILAKWIHENSARCGKPFVGVNCSALRGEMLASELFGHVKGAFTSAGQDKQGLLDLANGGTLFLDEIGDMNPELQAQLLKVIEERTYRRLGDVKERTSNFRLICATNRDLETACRKQEFRTDLYYRINHLPITLCALSECTSDIPALVTYLMEARHYPVPPLSKDILQYLQQYDWLGNIRELANVLERAVILADNGTMELEHFPELQSGRKRRQAPGHDSFSTLNSKDKESECILNALEKFNGNIELAGQAVGLSRATMYRRMKEMRQPQSVL